MSLSVILITKNEAANVDACLASVAFADEWIVVDSGSSDDTVARARAFGATVIERPDWAGFGVQKNRALDAATGDWVLSIDADERVPAALRHEIVAAIERGRFAAYAVPRLTYFYGHPVRHAGWYPDYAVRLFRRSAGRFSAALVHERVELADPAHGYLTTALEHYSYEDPDAYLRKVAQYSGLAAQQAFAAGKRSGLAAAVLHAVAAFLKSYLAKRGFLDGRAGLMIALLAAEGTYHKHLKLMLLGEAPRA